MAWRKGAWSRNPRRANPRTLTLSDPQLVARDYASEQGLLARRSLWASDPGAREPWDVALEAVVEARPQRILEVGPGPGEFAERLAKAGDHEVVAVDSSPRMVELARARGVDARLGDVQALDLPTGSFDCAVAAWMLYHFPDLDRAVAELARVLTDEGRLVATTNGRRNLAELWSLLGCEGGIELGFDCENGAEILGRRFARVRTLELTGTMTIPTRAAAHEYVSATLPRAHLADRLPDHGWPLRATRTNCVFVAEKTAA